MSRPPCEDEDAVFYWREAEERYGNPRSKEYNPENARRWRGFAMSRCREVEERKRGTITRYN